MKHIAIKLIHICMLALVSISLSAQTAWETANQHYADGQYEEAIICYENLLQDPAVRAEARAEVLYNLGNAYFKTGENARAILAYERCLRLDPRHQDAKHNLQFAEARIIDNIEDHQPFFLLQWAQTVRGWLNEETWLLWSVVLFVLCLVGMFIFAFMRQTVLRKTAFYTGVAAFCISLIALWCGLSLHHRDMVKEEAIIMQGVVNAKSSPDKSGTDLFVLHEGTKVHIGDRVGEWCEIHVGNNIGWIRQSALEQI